MWGTLPGKNHSDCLQRPITSARSPFSFSTLPKYTLDLAETSSPSCQSPDLAGNIFSFLPVARPRRKHLRLLASRPTLPKHHRILAGRPTLPETSSPSRRFLLPVHGLLLFLFRGSAQHFPDHIAVQAKGSGQLWNRRLHCPAYVGDQTGLLLQGQS